MTETNLEILKNILEDNKNTEYGKKYKFSEISNYAEYKNNVPISNYNDFKPYIERMYNGEDNILTSYPIETFNCTSGSEGQQKFIPLTRKAIDAYSIITETTNRNKLVREYRKQNQKGKRILIGIYGIDLNKNPDKYMLVSEALNFNFYKSNYMNLDEYIEGSLIFDPYTSDYLYEKAWCAILEENIILIESIYMYDILQFFNILEKNYIEIISDIRKGEINPDKKLSKKAKNFLLSLKYSEERLNFVEKECEKGFEDIASRLWKNLKLISGISSKSFIYENKALKKYIGNIPKDVFTFGSSEGIVGTSIKDNNYIYYLQPSFNFYEFIPYSESESEKDNVNDIIDINGIEKNKMYELVLTNLSGLYRYRTGDIIKIVNNNINGVFFEFCFRKNLVINIAGEKTSVNQIEKVMRKMDEIIPNIIEFSVGSTIYDNVGTYFLFLSLPDNQKNNINLEEIKNLFDLMICKENHIYEYLRNLNALGEPKIFLMGKEKYNKIFKIKTDEKRHNKSKFILSENFLNKILQNFKKSYKNNNS